MGAEATREPGALKGVMASGAWGDMSSVCRTQSALCMASMLPPLLALALCSVPCGPFHGVGCEELGGTWTTQQLKLVSASYRKVG